MINSSDRRPEDRLIQDFATTKAACEEKFRQGKIKYGTTFVGNPLAHLYSELIDAINYTQVAMDQGMMSKVGGTFTISTLTSEAEIIRHIYVNGEYDFDSTT